MRPEPIELIAACLFAAALIHTFAAKPFERLSHRFPRHAGVFHLFGEVEVVFGFWAMVLVIAMAFAQSAGEALAYAESRTTRTLCSCSWSWSLPARGQCSPQCDS